MHIIGTSQPVCDTDNKDRGATNDDDDDADIGIPLAKILVPCRLQSVLRFRLEQSNLYPRGYASQPYVKCKALKLIAIDSTYEDILGTSYTTTLL